jgi:large subunit ribosomal protein L15
LEAAFGDGDVVDARSLRARGLITDASGRRPVKLLAEGTLTKPLVVEVHRASAAARAAVEQVGGTLTLLGDAPAPAPGAPAPGAPAPGAEAE